MRERITDIENTLTGEWGTIDPGLVQNFDALSTKVGFMELAVRNITAMGEWRQPEAVKQKYIEVVEKVRVLSDKFDELSYDQNFQDKVTSISNEVLEIDSKIQELEESIAANKDSIQTLEGQVIFLNKAFRDTSYTLDKLEQSMKREEEPDKDHKYSIDTSQMASRRKQMLHVTEISVSMKPVQKTRLAFLYASPVENSLINDKESRLLAPFPVNSKNGYSYVEFAQPIYRDISVRQFMDISFYILDSNGKTIDFNLYGDDIDQEHREYPTILNLDIRRPRL